MEDILNVIDVISMRLFIFNTICSCFCYIWSFVPIQNYMIIVDSNHNLNRDQSPREIKNIGKTDETSLLYGKISRTSLHSIILLLL